RVNEFDFRVSKIVRFGRGRTNIGVDVYNLLNSAAVLTYNQTYSPTVTSGPTAWLAPTSVLTPRFPKISAQIDFLAHMTTRSLRSFALASVLALSVGGASSAPAPVTFNKDVLPILQKNCQACHRSGEVAPMKFTNYEETRPWAKAIRQAVVTRKMPPWF